MDTLLQQSSTAKVTMGPFVASSDGVTESTGLSPTVEVFKAGSSVWAARNSAVAISHQSKGWYEVPLDGTDTNTLGRMTLRAHASSVHLPVYRHFTVGSSHVVGGLVSGTDFLQVDSQQVGGATPDTSTDTASAVWSFGTTDSQAAGTFGADVAKSTGLFDASVDDVNVGSFNTDAIGSSALSAAAEGEISDKFLGRNIAGGSDSSRTVTETLQFLRNRVTLSGTTMTVFAEDDTATSWKATVTTSTDGHITEINPA